MRVEPWAAIRRTCVIMVAVCAGLTAESAWADVTSLTLNPTSVFGTDSSTGTVQLNIDPFGRPRTITLASSNPAVAAVPPSVTTGFRGNDRADFTITTHAVATSTNVVITATESGTSRQAVLTVRPPSLTSISFNPNPVRGSENSVATITINRPAPANWRCVFTGPYPPIYFAPGNDVYFLPGATSATKTVNTLAVASEVNALITAYPPGAQSPNVSATLQVVPTRVVSLTLAPSSVTGGAASLGCVTLNGAAEIGGASVVLASSDPTVADVQSALQIAQGDNDGCFLIQSHEGDGCRSAVISASFGGQTREQTLLVGDAIRLTDNAVNDRWNIRHSSTVGGKVLWTDGDNVFFEDGTTTQLVQARGDLDAVEDTVFGLGTAASPGEVIGAWRRGQDFAWVWRSSAAPVLVSAVNPIDPQQVMNPAAVAIADGHVFMVLRAVFDARDVKHVFEVDPVSGVAANLSGNLAVPGVSRITTSEGNAAWLFVDSADPKLHFFDGSVVTTIDSGEINNVRLRLSRGRLVYDKFADGVSDVFLYDRTLKNPAPVRISPATDAAHGHFAPITDGYHVAWLHGLADRTDLDILLYGGLQLNDASSRPFTPLGNIEFPLLLQRGQLLWKDTQADLRYYEDGVLDTVCSIPAAAFSAPWLADGWVAGFGPVLGSAETANEIYIWEGVPPSDAELPMPPMLVRAEPDYGGVILEWDRVLGASSYTSYLAESPGVTKTNYSSLPGGRRTAGLPRNAARVCLLTNDTAYSFVVTTIENGDEGGVSTEVSATPSASLAPDRDDVITRLACLGGPGDLSPLETCGVPNFLRTDLDCDGDADLADFARLLNLTHP